MNWVPLNDKILVRRIPDHKESALLYLPQIAQEKSHRGIVIAAGPGKWVEGVNPGLVRRPVDVKPGDIVRFSLNDWESFDSEHVIIQEGDIIFTERPN